jgi:uncharacterized RDD family membrane protein YckC
MTTPTDEPGENEDQSATGPEETPAPPPAYGQYGAPESAVPTGQYGAPAPYSGGGQPSPQGQYGATPGAPYASWLQRVGGSILDGLIIGVPAIILIIVGLAIGHGVGVVIAILGYLVAIGFSLWNIVFRQGATGQTLGKGIMGIKLIRETDGQPVGAGMSFIRQIAHILDGLCYVGYAWPLWDAKKQTFADKLCTTVVVNV